MMDTFEWRSAAVYMTAVREAIAAERKLPDARCCWSIEPYHLLIAASDYGPRISIQSFCLVNVWNWRRKQRRLSVCSAVNQT